MANNTILASDNWASGTLAAGWSALAALGNVPNVAGTSPKVTEPTSTSAESFIYWSALTWPNDQASEIVMQALTNESSTFAVLGVRLNPTNGAGYIMNLVGGTATVEYFNGTTATTLFTVTGITIAAGDVLTLQAAGSCVTLMKNGSRLGTVGDTNATSGYPGFGQASSTNVTHTQVSAWRGYSAVQQDGVWTKQGVVFAPNATDLQGWGIYEGSCIYDTNPVLLTQYSNVYKLWFSGGSTTGSAQHSFYAESPDLVNWTRQAAPIISSFVAPQVIKNNGTYYLYCQASNAQGTGTIAYYTSPDGVTWTQQSTNVLAASGTSWEGTSIYPLKPMAIVNGTWYALWGSLNTGTGKIGLATSTDGAGAIWTKYVGNPVLPNAATKGGAYPYQCIAQVGNTFYIWMQKTPTSSMGAASTLFDPNDIVRYSTTDFINYSAPVMGMHHTQIQEAVNTPVNNTEEVGGIAPTAIFNIGGKAHMLYEGTQGDSLTPVIAQWQLAVAPTSIANLVQFNEDAVQQTATDAFTSGTGPLNGNWSNVFGFSAMKIVAGNLAEPSSQSSVGCAAAYTAGGLQTSQYAEITLATLANGGGYLSPQVLLNTATGVCYMVNLITGPTGTQGFKAAIAYYNGSSFVNLTGSVGITPTVGDVLRLSAVQVSGGVVLSLFQNGFLLAQGEDYSSAYLTSGYPGFAGTENGSANSQISLFGTGTANTIPNYPASGGGGQTGLQLSMDASLRNSGVRH